MAKLVGHVILMKLMSKISLKSKERGHNFKLHEHHFTLCTSMTFYSVGFHVIYSLFPLICFVFKDTVNVGKNTIRKVGDQRKEFIARPLNLKIMSDLKIVSDTKLFNIIFSNSRNF